MCGRYTLTSWGSLQDAFDLDEPASGAPRYNIAPGQVVPILRNRAERVLSGARWGLVPSWARDPAIGNKMINARAETAAEKPAFRSALRKRRCLVVADGFYEWKRPPDGAGQAGRGGRARRAGRKTPYYVRRVSHQPFAMAGLWERWQGPDGSLLETCTILTGDANPLMAPIHHRMPIILDRAAHERWLSPEPLPPEAVRELLRPPPADGFEAYPVSPLVNTPQNDDPACIEPAPEGQDEERARPAPEARPVQTSLFDPE